MTEFYPEDQDGFDEKVTRTMKAMASVRKSQPMNTDGIILEDTLEPLVHIEDIRDGQCRWPITDMVWCGRPSGDNIYCEEHHARAKSKAQPVGGES